MSRIALIHDERGVVTYVTDSPNLEVYSVSRHFVNGMPSWSEVYRSGPSIDRVFPLTFDRIVGDTNKIGHFGDMARANQKEEMQETRAERSERTRGQGRRK